MANLSQEDRALIRLYTDDPPSPDEVVKDAVLDELWLGLEEVEAVSSRVWRIKAATVADWYLANVDGSFLSRNQVFDHCIEMAKYYEGISTVTGLSGVMVNVGLEGPNHVSEDSSSEF